MNHFYRMSRWSDSCRCTLEIGMAPPLQRSWDIAVALAAHEESAMRWDMSGRSQVRVREIGVPAEARRRDAFRAIVEAQDNGATVLAARRDVARQFGLSPTMLQAIESEGIIYDWPPLGPEVTESSAIPAIKDVSSTRIAPPPPAAAKGPLPDSPSDAPVRKIEPEEWIAHYRDRLRTAWEGQVRSSRAAGE
jgi:hypothetical protein